MGGWWGTPNSGPTRGCRMTVGPARPRPPNTTTPRTLRGPSEPPEPFQVPPDTAAIGRVDLPSASASVLEVRRVHERDEEEGIGNIKRTFLCWLRPESNSLLGTATSSHAPPQAGEHWR